MKGEQGFALIEVLISVAVLSIIAVCFLSSLSTASMATLTTDERETAKNLAETQMEYVKGLGYATSYTSASIPPEYSTYNATIGVEPLHEDGKIQKITVTITHQGIAVMHLENFKVK